MRIKDLVPGLNDVAISGRVLLSWPPQDFQRKDGTPGRVMRITLVDKTERARCAIWDRHVDVLLRTPDLQGRILRIGHAYTRQGLAGDTEVHAGDRSSIELDPEDMPKSELPEFGDLFTPLAKLAAGTNQVNAVGVVQSSPRYYSFTKDERTGSVLRTLVTDESGAIPFVAWNERAEELKEIKAGEILQALNCRIRLDRNGNPELHIESRSQVQILTTPPAYLKPPVVKSYKIRELSPKGSVNLIACVLAVGKPQEIKRPSGDIVRLTRLLVSDETGMITLSLWDDKSDLAKDLRDGDIIELAGASVRERQGENMLSLGRSGTLQKTSAKQITTQGTTKLNALPQSKGLVLVEGTVADTPMPRQVVTERGEKIDLVSFTLRDDTSACRTTFWREQANEALKLRSGAHVRIQGVRVRTGLTGDFELSSIPLSRLEIIDDAALEGPSKDRPAWEDIRHVIALEDGLKTWVKGIILEVLETPKIALLCESCASVLRFEEDKQICENCGQPRAGKTSLTARIRVDDGTGVVDVQLLHTDVPDWLCDRKETENQLLTSRVSEIQLSKEQSFKLIGKEIELNGTAARVAGHDKLEFIADRIVLATTP